MDPIEQLPPVLQALIGVGAFGLIFVIGRYIALALGILRWLWLYWNPVRGMKDSDDSRRSMAVPHKYADTARLITDAGYVPLGSMLRTYPRGGGSLIYHVYRTPDDVTLARFHQTPMADLNISITTWFTDHSVVMTEYPHGQRLETDRIVSRYVRGSFAAAQAYHEKRVAAWTAQGREVMPIGSMADYLDRQQYFLKHYIPLYGHPIRTQFLLLLAPTVLAALAAAGLLVSIYKLEPVWIGVMIAAQGLAVGARYALITRARRLVRHPVGAADDD